MGYKVLVRPLTGAGIEMVPLAESQRVPPVRPLTGAGIEIITFFRLDTALNRSPPHGGGN